MLDCWKEAPEDRPDFEQIVTRLQTQINSIFFKNYQVIRKLYEESNQERLVDEARLYETLQGINHKSSIKGAAQPDYLAMSDHFSRQSSRVEENKSLSIIPDIHDVDMNYVQMELPSSSNSFQKANSSS